MPNFLQIATALVEKGFSVIPIESGGKRPCPGMGVTAKVGKATSIGSDILSILHLWAAKWPDANVGICADESTVILETDDLEQLCQVVRNGAGRELPITLMACGSSENRPHLFFKRTEMSSNVGNLVVPGLFEARFDNQYVVGPGSVHPSGAVYRFLNDAPMVPIPDWLVSELARLALSQKGNERKTVEVYGGRVPEGSRHYFLMRELGRLWDGSIGEEELTERAFELNTLCDPPKDEAHVRQCVRDIMRREPYNAGPKVLIGSGQAVRPRETELTTSSADAAQEVFKYPSVAGRTRDYVLAPLHNAFDGWFPRGRISIVGGSSGVGKTTLIVDLLRKQRAGEKFLGHQGAELPFLILFADRTVLSNRETLERMGMDADTVPIDYMPICWDGASVNKILSIVEQKRCPAVVFVEGADALVSDANKAQVVAPFMTGLQKIAEWYHTAIILSCGAPKQKPKDQYAQTRDRIFGSQMWARMAEDVLTLTYGEKDSDTRLLTIEHRNAKREKFTLEWKDGLLSERSPETELAGVSETRSAKVDEQAEMIRVIESRPIGSVIRLNDFPWLADSTASVYLKELARPDGWVGKNEAGKWIVKKANQAKERSTA